MTPNPRPQPQVAPARRHGLRVRLWVACLLGAFVTAIASACVISAVAMAGAALDPIIVMEAIGGACLLGFAVSVFAGWWITRGIAQNLRDLEEGIARGHLPEATRAGEWGEIGAITRAVRALLENDRDLREDEAELRALVGSIDRARESVERWMRSERWELLTPGSGSLGPLADALDRGIVRVNELQEQNLEAANLAHAELLGVIDEARGSAEMAEHGYVEVTALLTTIREIARLTGEIQQALNAPVPEAAHEAAPAEHEWRDRAAQAIEELVEVSGESVQRLGEGLMHVREINDQVQLMSNRATLIALNAVVGSGRPEGRVGSGEGSNAELKQLAREVRASTERVSALTAEIDRAVVSANERMHAVREHVLARLVELPLPPPMLPAVADAAPPLLAHWVERMREMVQDAARKGERMAESQEKVSSSVQRLSRRLEDEARDVEGLVSRLTPMGIAAGGELTRAKHSPAGGSVEAFDVRALRLIDPDAAPPRRVDPSPGNQQGGV